MQQVAGSIRISSRVASGRMGNQLWLMNALTDRFVVLHGRSEPLWLRIEQGNATVEGLIDDQVAATGVPRDTAAFEVVAFLDELRALGLIDFSLADERQHAPLIDTPLGPEDLKGRDLSSMLRGGRPFDANEGRFVKLSATDKSVAIEDLIHRAKTEPDTQETDALLVAAHPSNKLTIGRILDRAKEAFPDLEYDDHKLLVLRGAPPDLDLATLETLLDDTKGTTASTGTVDMLWTPNMDLTLGEVEGWGSKRGALAGLLVGRKGFLIVIAAWFIYDYISRGKSRHACKTVCN